MCLFFTVFSFAQSSTEKYNQILNRYEYFDANGTLTGYKTYNNILKQWEYFTEESTDREYNKPTDPYNIPMLQRVMEAKTNTFNSNSQRLQSAVEDINSKFLDLRLSDQVKEKLHQDFGTYYVNKLNDKTVKYDLANTSSVNGVIQWLYNGANSMVKNELEKARPKDDEVIAFAQYHGGYKVPVVLEYVYKDNKYTLTKTEKVSGNYFYYSGDVMYFKRANGKDWNFRPLKSPFYNQYMKAYTYKTPYGLVVLFEDFKSITLVDEINGKITGKYEFAIGDYDVNIYPKQ